MRQYSWKAYLLVIFVFSITFTAAYFTLSFAYAPYLHPIEHSWAPWSEQLSSNASSAIGGVWSTNSSRFYPSPGSTNVSRDVALQIDGASLSVENLSLTPQTPIWVSGTNGQYLNILTQKVLQPNTTYNVTALVNGGPSWWVFSTASTPSKFTTENHVDSVAVSPSLLVASLATLIAYIILTVRHKNIQSAHNP